MTNITGFLPSFLFNALIVLGAPGMIGNSLYVLFGVSTIGITNYDFSQIYLQAALPSTVSANSLLAFNLLKFSGRDCDSAAIGGCSGLRAFL